MKKVIMYGSRINGVLTITFVKDGIKSTITLQKIKPFAREGSQKSG